MTGIGEALGGWTYLTFELVWALPVLILHWAVGWSDLLASWKRLAIAVIASTLYLSFAELGGNRSGYLVDQSAPDGRHPCRQPAARGDHILLRDEPDGGADGDSRPGAGLPPVAWTLHRAGKAGLAGSKIVGADQEPGPGKLDHWQRRSPSMLRLVRHSLRRCNRYGEVSSPDQMAGFDRRRGLLQHQRARSRASIPEENQERQCAK